MAFNSPFPRILVPPLGGAGAVTVIPYLLRDRFVTDEAYPLGTVRACEPGPGSLMVNDWTNQLSIASGELVMPDARCANIYSPMLWAKDNYDLRVAGSALIVSTYMRDGTYSERMSFGIAHTSLSRNYGFRYIDSTSGNVIKSGQEDTFLSSMNTLSNTTPNIFVLTSRATPDGGAIYFIKSGVDSTWRCVWVGYITQFSASAKFSWQVESTSYSGYSKTQFIRMARLTAGLETRWGYATDYKVPAIIGDTINHAADSWVYARFAAIVGATVNVAFRRSDDNNCWYARYTEGASDTIKLIERNASVETERASAAATPGSPHGVGAVFEGNAIIAIYFRSGDQVSKTASYSSSFNNTATTAKLIDMASSEFGSFPVYPPAAIVTELERFCGASPGAETYLFDEEFTTAQAAPIGNYRTCEPGPGTFSVVDSSYVYSIASGLLVGRDGNAHQDTDFLVTPIGYPATGGVTMLFKVKRKDASTRVRFGWIPINSFDYPYAGINVWQTNFTFTIWSRGLSFDIPMTNLTWYTVGVMNLTPNSGQEGGMLFLLKDGSTWKIINGGPQTGVSVGVSRLALFGQTKDNSYKGYIDADDYTIADLPAPFTTRYGLSTAYIANQIVGDNIAHTANGLVWAGRIMFSDPNGTVYNLMFRRTDDNNCWITRVTKDVASTVKLIEKNAGVETERRSNTASFADPGYVTYVGGRCSDNNVNGFMMGRGGYCTYAGSSPYTSAFNNTATNVKVDFAGVELVSYPETITDATAINVLNTYMP